MERSSPARAACAVTLAIAAAFAMSGCLPVRPATDSGGAQPPAEATAVAPAAAGSQSATAPGAAEPGVSQPSQAALEYASQLGGASHDGETLFFIIGESLGSEAAAQAALEAARPSFGDMQDYFIVQRSDNFVGMKPGWWVVIEAYRYKPGDENMQFAKRGFPGAYAKQATVHTADPIPVYEDLVDAP
ncbi:MAG TPA: hypothetical protein VF902_05475 [Coriobacteriia bacterium]